MNTMAEFHDVIRKLNEKGYKPPYGEVLVGAGPEVGGVLDFHVWPTSEVCVTVRMRSEEYGPLTPEEMSKEVMDRARKMAQGDRGETTGSR